MKKEWIYVVIGVLLIFFAEFMKDQPENERKKIEPVKITAQKVPLRYEEPTRRISSELDTIEFELYAPHKYVQDEKNEDFYIASDEVEILIKEFNNSSDAINYMNEMHNYLAEDIIDYNKYIGKKFNISGSNILTVHYEYLYKNLNKYTSYFVLISDGDKCVVAFVGTYYDIKEYNSEIKKILRSIKIKENVI